MGAPVKVYLESYGCALNRGDANVMKTLLLEDGHELVESPETADVIVLNTCIVRAETEAKMVKRLAELSKLGKKVIVCGCMARALPALARRVKPDAILLAPQSVHRITAALHAPPGSAFFDEVKVYVKMPKIIDGVKATIPVAEGCLDTCSFCIVKLARPHLRSVPIELVLTGIKEALARGAVEIEITAQDLGVYGYDIYGRYALPHLLQAILEIEGDFIVRLGQMNPRYVTNYLDELIEALKAPKLYKHVHIPVQSGSDEVLRYMKRGHTVEDFVNVVTELRKKVEGIHIATDIMVGHPGEDEEAFLESVRLIMELSIDRVHIARYTPRPLTESSLMPQIPDPVKKRRSSYIERVYEAVAQKVNMDYVGALATIWVTEVDHEGRAVGRLFNYVPVVIKRGGPHLLGKKALVKVEEATFYDLRGTLIEVW